MTDSSGPTEIGARISAAREGRHLTQGELAAEVAIDRSAMNRIEHGTRRVTAYELSEIARVLGRRMEWFLSDPTPSIVSHREREGTSLESIDTALEALTREVEFVASVGGKLTLRTYGPKPVPHTVEAAEELATRVRSDLGLDGIPLTELVGASEDLGLLPFSTPLGTDAADGGSILLETGGVALVNSSADVGRRRMTLAHEIGHYVVADTYTVDHSVLLGSTGDRESLLDRFARALLCPRDATTSYWRQQLGTYGELRSAALRTASHWRVDFATLARRLLDLGLIDLSQAQSIRAIKAVKADFVELNLHVPDELRGVSLAPSFERAVLGLFRAETISAARAVELLRGTYEDEDLPERPTNPEAATWQVVW